MDYKFKKYSSSYLPSLTLLLDKSFSIENKDKMGLINWKYFDEYLRNTTVTYIALDRNNDVVSHYTNVPSFITYQNKTYTTMICTDMCTDREHRGKGLISELSARVYRDVVNGKYDFSLGFSNDDGVKVDKYSQNYGYHIVGRFVRYFKVVVYRKNVKYKLVKTSSLNHNFNSRSSKYFKIKKDHSYLYWRYLKKPNSEYDLYSIIEGNTVIGYVVLRFVKFKCYIYDIISQNDEKRHMVTILRSIENKAMDHGIRVIIYNVLDNAYWKSFFNKYKYFMRSNNNINYYLTIKIHNKYLPTNLILNKENWVLMNGDIL